LKKNLGEYTSAALKKQVVVIGPSKRKITV